MSRSTTSVPGSRVNDCAASQIASPIVRYGFQLDASCATVIAPSIAYTPARIASPAPSGSRCTPTTRPLSMLGDELDEPTVVTTDDRPRDVLEPEYP